MRKKGGPVDTRKRIKKIDQWMFHFLWKNAAIMPKRAVKYIANYYPDARLRKLYWLKLGVVMGKNTYANLGFTTTSNFRKLIFIGDNVSIGPNVTIICDSCANNGREINEIDEVRERLTKCEPVFIEDEAWIGAGVIILPGVRIGRCAVIGAGSVVTNDVEPYAIYAGVPAKKVRILERHGNHDK